MALLRDRRGGYAGLVLALAVLGGCVFLGMDEEDRLAFSHRLHVQDEGLDCSSCHLTYDSEDDPGMPVRAQCMLCHESIDEEQPPERRIDVLFEGDRFAAQRVSRLSDEIVFSHLDHAIDESLCGTCHEGIEESDRLNPAMAVTMDECTACHENLGVPTECATCHSVIREDVPPPSHDGAWTKLHGPTFLARFEGVANRCDMCHDDSSCESCHFEQAPENHDNYWRRRGHGLTARMNRDSCLVCHRTDSCDRCHRENPPLNHHGMWGNPINQHCLSCHITNQGDCNVCHSGAPSHSMATPQPADHSPGMNCLQCHGISAPLPHVNKGDDCTICHQ